MDTGVTTRTRTHTLLFRNIKPWWCFKPLRHDMPHVMKALVFSSAFHVCGPQFESLGFQNCNTCVLKQDAWPLLLHHLGGTYKSGVLKTINMFKRPQYNNRWEKGFVPAFVASDALPYRILNRLWWESFLGCSLTWHIKPMRAIWMPVYTNLA